MRNAAPRDFKPKIMKQDLFAGPVPKNALQSQPESFCHLTKHPQSRIVFDAFPQIAINRTRATHEFCDH